MSPSDTTTIQPRSTFPHPTPPARPGNPRRLVRWIAGGAAVALTGLLLGLCGAGPSRTSSSDPGSAVDVLGGEDGGGFLDGTFPDDFDTDGYDTDGYDTDGYDTDGYDTDGYETGPEGSGPEGSGLEGSSGQIPQGGGGVDEPDPDPEGGAAAELDQTGDTPEVEEPPPPVDPIPATLVVTPDPLHLKAGVYTGSITIANGGDQVMDWVASTKPWVSLSDTQGQLGAQAENVVSFTVDPSGLPAGGFTFKIKVTGNGGTTYVDVHGAKPFDEINF